MQNSLIWIYVYKLLCSSECLLETAFQGGWRKMNNGNYMAFLTERLMDNYSISIKDNYQLITYNFSMALVNKCLFVVKEWSISDKRIQNWVY